MKIYVTEIAILVYDLTKAAGRRFEQEHLRMIHMVSAINPGGSGGQGGNRFTAKGIMERKVVENLRSHYGDEVRRISGDVRNILLDKAENEAYDKIKLIHKGHGVVAYGVLYRWFSDVSGLGLAEQARMLMHPSPPKREEELAEHVEMWQGKMKRLEAHGEEYKLAPMFKINALHMFMTGKA